MQNLRGTLARFWLVGILFLLLGVFSAGQTISVSPKSGPPTTKLNVSGSGFSPNSAVDIYFDTTDEILVISDGTGAIAKTTLKTPASAVPGQHWVSAVQRSTGTGSQAAFTVSTNWSQVGFDPAHRGWNQYENVLNTSNVGSLDLLWTNNFGQSVVSSTSVVGSRVYFATNDAVAANASNGSSVWTFAAQNSVPSTPAVASSNVCTGSLDDNIYLLNASTGAVLHSYTTGGWLTASATVANGLCYAGSWDHNFYAMYLSDGFIPWVYVTGGPIVTTAAVANGIVYVTSQDGYLYALNASNGTLIWQFNMGDGSGNGPIVANGLVFVPTASSLLAINAKTGFQEWSLSTFVTHFDEDPALAAANSMLYFCGSGGLNAVHSGNGSLSWFDSIPCFHLSVANGVLYASADTDLLYAVDSTNGNILWQYSVFNIYGIPTVVNGTIYVGDLGGNVSAFGLPVSAAPKAPARPALESLSPNLDLKP